MSLCRGFIQTELCYTRQWVFSFSLKPIFATATAASKNDNDFESGQKWRENNNLNSLV